MMGVKKLTLLLHLSTWMNKSQQCHRNPSPYATIKLLNGYIQNRPVLLTQKVSNIVWPCSKQQKVWRRQHCWLCVFIGNVSAIGFYFNVGCYIQVRGSIKVSHWVITATGRGQWYLTYHPVVQPHSLVWDIIITANCFV